MTTTGMMTDVMTVMVVQVIVMIVMVGAEAGTGPHLEGKMC